MEVHEAKERKLAVDYDGATARINRLELLTVIEPRKLTTAVQALQDDVEYLIQSVTNLESIVQTQDQDIESLQNGIQFMQDLTLADESLCQDDGLGSSPVAPTLQDEFKAIRMHGDYELYVLRLFRLKSLMPDASPTCVLPSNFGRGAQICF